ncbi:PREDICTED: 21 kDa protein-like [Nelumbo nucifera]|uniref:Pectinesterase inhibitor domain-containing protein n=2 Tax=Nelumbo nucifera TaxID=4432 RepID=A0A823A2I6_NELNU|nr:PREDICTED: 21 kDa protein-like [Nelumbo nucifera]DAD49136.1 TPA_asm: hypothetical protein HUJ06_019073 [Nelumbo nucifera]
MALLPSLFAFFILFLSLSHSARCTTAASRSGTPGDLVRSSCIHASYPNLCLRTLSSYTGSTRTANDLARAAVTVSLSRARAVSGCIARLAKLHGGSKRQQGALRDCVEQLSDSVDELRETLAELRHLRRGSFRWQMSNAETWVSAALTNEDTCLDGFEKVDGKVKLAVRRKINNVARVTSNALYFINRLDESHGRAQAAFDP